MKLKRWADDWIALVSAPLSAEQQAETVRRLMESQRYWTSLIEERGARPRNDLISALVAASRQDETPSASISLHQMINACSVIALAGHETTANLLGNCLYRLLSLPEQWDLVCSDRANISKAVEETLRAETSVPALMRTTTQPVTLGGVELPNGARLAVLFDSENHDEAYFPDPDRLDLRRQDVRGHLAFGRGIHSALAHRSHASKLASRSSS